MMINILKRSRSGQVLVNLVTRGNQSIRFENDKEIQKITTSNLKV